MERIATVAVILSRTPNLWLGGIIPWDEDADVGILHEWDKRLWAARRRVPSPYRLVRLSRLWSLDKLLPIVQSWWPRRTFLRWVHVPTGVFIDVFEYRRTGRTIECLPWLWTNVKCRRAPCCGNLLPSHWIDTVFPLRRDLTFEGRSYPVPRDVVAYLYDMYGTDLSPDRVWDSGVRRWIRRKA